MESINQNIATKYIPRSYGYPHTCPLCEKVFYGRKNKKYCSIEHKIIANNQKASEIRALAGNQIRVLERNICIIHEICQGKTTPIKIKKEEILRKGYISGGPSIIIKDSEHNKWLLIGNYVLGTEKIPDFITVMTIDDFKKL